MSARQRLHDAEKVLAQGRLEDAAKLIEEVLDEAPELAEAHYRMAIVAGRLGHDADEVEDSLVMAVHHDPAHVEALLALAALQQAGGRHEAAEAVLRQAAARRPGAVVMTALGDCLRKMARFGEASEIFKEACLASPGDAPLRATLGLAQFEAGDLDAAEASCREALRIDPECVEALHNLALVRYHSANLEEARGLAERALARRPSSARTASLLGHVLRDSGDSRAALRHYSEALRIEPGLSDARINRCYTYLADGDYSLGWPEYAARFTVDDFPPRGLPFPEWQGEELQGQGLLVYAEQGVGDEIMFASCLADIVARGARVVLECSVRLAPLFARSFPGIEVHGMEKSDAPHWAAQLRGIRWQVAIGDLPRFFRPDGAAFPQRTDGYLLPDAARVRTLRERLADTSGGRPTIGMSWRGGNWHTGRRRRSIDAGALARLLQGLPAQFVSLQHGEVEADLAVFAASGARFAHWPQAIADLDELTALASALDFVVTVDNTVVHICGALGRSVHVLLCAAPEWRYGRSGESMSWYPRARLYRQTTLGDWQPAIGRVHSVLRTLVHAP